MTPSRLTLLLPLFALLAGCGGGRDRDAAIAGVPVPAALASACDSQVNQDPVVKDLIMKGAGSEHFKLENEDTLRLARQRARLACLQGRGVLPRGGGVEPQRPL